MDLIEPLLRDIDAQWKLRGSEKVPLHLIGCGALLLQTDYNRGTKDGDVIETAALDNDVRTHLLQLAGKHTSLHRRHRLYIEIVSSGLPFLPHAPMYHAVQSLKMLVHLDVFALDVVDVVVTKLKRFHSNDQADITAMIEGGHVDHEKLIERFSSAFDVFTADARADELPRYVKNLNRVERDLFGVDETLFSYPEWLDV